MHIWNKDWTVADLAERNRGTLIDHLGIRITQVGEDFLRGEMPVDQRTRQPAGILHGGASLVLAENSGEHSGQYGCG